MAEQTNKPAEILQDYYKLKGAERNDPLNPEVLFQQLAHRVALLRCFADIPRDAKILDIGGGDGNALMTLLSCGFQRQGLHLVDMIEERVAIAHQNLGTENIHCANMLDLPYEDGLFDVVFSSTVFLQITDDPLAKAIGRKMRQLVKPGGQIFVFDWIYDGGRTGYKAVNRARLNEIFELESGLKLIDTEKGALVPPLGRILSKHFPSLYFLVQKMPMATGMLGYKLQKTKGS